MIPIPIIIDSISGPITNSSSELFVINNMSYNIIKSILDEIDSCWMDHYNITSLEARPRYVNFIFDFGNYPWDRFQNIPSHINPYEIFEVDIFGTISVKLSHIHLLPNILFIESNYDNPIESLHNQLVEVFGSSYHIG